VNDDGDSDTDTGESITAAVLSKKGRAKHYQPPKPRPAALNRLSVCLIGVLSSPSLYSCQADIRRHALALMKRADSHAPLPPPPSKRQVEVFESNYYNRGAAPTLFRILVLLYGIRCFHP
jgi:hypothetical protein